ncbi:hypothetical protein WD_0808 [Wolbachia endosymbiont of Drosophila melanogaster]|nr:hypothetical protein WD_0808 [Wolbachia endosymbiont of Drosophila melanogaster]
MLTSKLSWIPVSGHWDDIIGTLGLHPDNRHPATC